jgi:hypothetical protein
VSEFGVKGIDNLSTTIYNKFIEAMLYEFSNRVSYINDTNYGNKKNIVPSLQFDKEDVFKVAQRILVECVQKYLPQRTYQTSTEFSKVVRDSVDEVDTILKRRSSDVVITPKPPVVTVTKKKEPRPTELQLEREIEKQIPANVPRPSFAQPTTGDKAVNVRPSNLVGTTIRNTRPTNPLRRPGTL